MKERNARTAWLTGLPCAGKSTLARALEQMFARDGRLVRVLDGDIIREGLCKDLRFSPAERSENIRRVAEVARLFNDTGICVVTALISPMIADREMARAIIGTERFLEIYLNPSLEVCERRDTKGMYARARRGELSEFTGVSAPYEMPPAPHRVIDTDRKSIAQAADAIYACLT